MLLSGADMVLNMVPNIGHINTYLHDHVHQTSFPLFLSGQPFWKKVQNETLEVDSGKTNH